MTQKHKYIVTITGIDELVSNDVINYIETALQCEKGFRDIHDPFYHLENEQFNVQKVRPTTSKGEIRINLQKNATDDEMVEIYDKGHKMLWSVIHQDCLTMQMDQSIIDRLDNEESIPFDMTEAEPDEE